MHIMNCPLFSCFARRQINSDSTGLSVAWMMPRGSFYLFIVKFCFCYAHGNIVLLALLVKAFIRLLAFGVFYLLV